MCGCLSVGSFLDQCVTDFDIAVFIISEPEVKAIVHLMESIETQAATSAEYNNQVCDDDEVECVVVP